MLPRSSPQQLALTRILDEGVFGCLTVLALRHISGAISHMCSFQTVAARCLNAKGTQCHALMHLSIGTL